MPNRLLPLVPRQFVVEQVVTASITLPWFVVCGVRPVAAQSAQGIDADVGRDIEALDPWLAEATTSSLAAFARALLRDIDAVRAALILP